MGALVEAVNGGSGTVILVAGAAVGGGSGVVVYALQSTGEEFAIRVFSFSLRA